MLGLVVGADGSVTEPLGRPELPARIRVVLRRTAVAPMPAAASRADVLTFASRRLDLRDRA